jgi:aldehyde oxidoreductase
MIHFQLNGEAIDFSGNPERTLLQFLREERRLTAAKDGCSGEGTCGACLVEVNGKALLACSTTMEKVQDTIIYTLEGIPPAIRQNIATLFVNHGAVQCGFCTPGFVMRTHLLLRENPTPSPDDIQVAIKGHLCRCTGYKKIESAMAESAISISQSTIPLAVSGAIGTPAPVHHALQSALGQQKYISDMYFEGMLYGALLFSQHPRAKILAIDVSIAKQMPGVKGVYTAKEIPGDRFTGIIKKDWPLMIAVGETTHYTGDVLAGVVAESEEQARYAVAAIEVKYEVFDPVTNPEQALKKESVQVHRKKSNLLETFKINKGDADKALKTADFVISGTYNTQRIEHAFLETEAAIALWEDGGITLYSSGQGIYEDRRQVAQITNMREKKVRVIHVAAGGAFGGKEDLSVQGHAALFARLLKKPVKVALNRSESIRMHPKRHPVTISITLACDENGVLTAMKLKAIGDTGAYASTGTKIMQRIATHATGGYFIPNIEVETLTVYTNNPPSGSMRGYGADQVVFALESCIDDLCKMGEFDRWQFRYDNALTEGLTTAAGDHVKGVGIIACLEALKPYYLENPYSGLACAIKGSGIGNGNKDYSEVIVEIISPEKIIIHHGWSDMGQGIHTIAAQVLCQETGIDPSVVEVLCDTQSGIKTGMTTSSRATVILGNAIIDACKKLKKELKKKDITKLSGRKYQGYWECNWTRKPPTSRKNGVIHYSYGYAAQLAVLNRQGKIEKIYAAHDAGKILNPLLFEGQIQGAIHMGLGTALSEEMPAENGQLLKTTLGECGILRANETPAIQVIGIEIPDPVGPYGAKGLNDIGLVPTVAAVANAFCRFDGIRRNKLPLQPIVKR